MNMANCCCSGTYYQNCLDRASGVIISWFWILDSKQIFLFLNLRVISSAYLGSIMSYYHYLIFYIHYITIIPLYDIIINGFFIQFLGYFFRLFHLHKRTILSLISFLFYPFFFGTYNCYYCNYITIHRLAHPCNAL